MAERGKERTAAVSLMDLRAVAARFLEDERYREVVEEISRTTLGDAANELNAELNDPKVQDLAQEMLVGRLLASGAGRLTLGQMKAGACDCCKWEAALAGSLVEQPG
jgi:hypothetical protein